MISLRGAFAIVLTVSFITFVAFFGRLPVFRRTPIGFLNRLVLVTIPAGIRWIDTRVIGGRLLQGSKRLSNYLLYEKHPLVIIFFLGLITGSAVLFIPHAWHSLPAKHHFILPILLPLPFLFTYLSARVRPKSYITADNHDYHMRLYPYDKILYHPENVCRTCHFAKPARSKHCSICKACVARSDHHCIWVNNCLGRGNHRWFLALLLTTGMLLAYGAYLAYLVLAPQIAAHLTARETQRIESGEAEVSRSLFDTVSLYLNLAMRFGGASITGVGLLALFTFPMPLGLLAYHIYLIWAGMTTNESSKWADLRDDMLDGMVYLGRRRPEYYSSYAPASARFPPQRLDHGIDLASEPTTAWPVRCRQLVVRTKDGRPPTATPLELRSVLDDNGWRQCRGLQEIENAYDLGFWDNFWEVMT